MVGLEPAAEPVFEPIPELPDEVFDPEEPEFAPDPPIPAAPGGGCRDACDPPDPGGPTRALCT